MNDAYTIPALESSELIGAHLRWELDGARGRMEGHVDRFDANGNAAHAHYT